MSLRSSLPSVTTAPAGLSVAADRVESRIDTLFAAELTRWKALDPDLVEPLMAVRRLIDVGGKRLRPAFCYWGFVAAGGDPDDAAIVEAGAAFELLHAFALIHDDVMDGSGTRRGEATVHRRFADRHSDQAWLGEPRRFGEGVAILAGNLAHVYADLLIDAATHAGARPQVAPLWHEMRLELNIGQFLDVLGTARADRDPERARTISRYKSGKYTIERPLHVGCALAGRLDTLQGPLSAYGDPLGEAFQLRDDVLGVVGDEELTGKPVGRDLREGKPTPLLAAAHTRASGAQREVLGLVGTPDLPDAAVGEIQQILRETGAMEEIEERIALLAGRAVAAIEAAPVAAHARSALVDLAGFVAFRSA